MKSIPKDLRKRLDKLRHPRTRALRARDNVRARGVEGMWPGATLLNGAHIEVQARGSRLYIEQLWVSPELRGSGRGRELVEMIQEIARQYGVTVETRAQPFGLGKRLSKPVLVAWYERLGFVSEGDEKLVWRPT